jgi:transcriptional regulator with XRE-family HTH domain
MSNFNQVVGDFIKQQRLSKNPRMTQSMLAKSLGVTFQQVQKYETGANGMSLQKFLLAMKFLQCNLNGVPFILDTLSYDTDNADDKGVPITQEIDHAESKEL